MKNLTTAILIFIANMAFWTHSALAISPDYQVVTTVTGFDQKRVKLKWGQQELWFPRTQVKAEGKLKMGQEFEVPVELLERTPPTKPKR